MLEHLRQRVIAALTNSRTATLSTYGPAGLQSSRLPCEAVEMRLYVLIPRTSDHLFNIETRPEVVAVNSRWNLNGAARVLPPGKCPVALRLAQHPEMPWSVIVEIRPCRLNILRAEQGGSSETIDIVDEAPPSTHLPGEEEKNGL